MNRRKLLIYVFMVLGASAAWFTTDFLAFGYESSFIQKRVVYQDASTKEFSFMYLGLFECKGLYGYSRVTMEFEPDSKRIRRVCYWNGSKPCTNKNGVARIELKYYELGKSSCIEKSHYDELGNLVDGSGRANFAKGERCSDETGETTHTAFFDSNGKELGTRHCSVASIKDTILDMDLHW